MKRRTKFKALGWGMILMAAGAASVEARAGLPDLALLLKTPIGRFVMTRTEEGALLSKAVLGEELTSLKQVDRLLSVLGRQEAMPLAADLEVRLARIHGNFQRNASTTQAPATQILQRLAGTELAVDGFTQGIKLLPAAGAQSFSEDMAKFFASNPLKSGKLAGQSEVGRVFEQPLSFRGADLRFADLRQISGRLLNFESARLESADFSKARLIEPNLARTSLPGASLRDAKLVRADFSGAELAGADFRGSILNGSKFNGADLRGANLTDTIMDKPNFQKGIGAEFEGAIYDESTQLPFSKEVAQELGMIFVDG